MIRTIACPYFRRTFGWCIPIGALGGLIGLGGGEFRLPQLMHATGGCVLLAAAGETIASHANGDTAGA
jgi:hypothetical protein